MKNKNILLVVLAIAVFCLIECSSTSTSTTPRIRDVPYTFGQNENANGTATIIFAHHPYGFRFVDFEGEQLPEPEEGTQWYPLQFPAGRELNIRLYISWSGHMEDGVWVDEPGYRRRGIFKCPPLEAGKTYKLWYDRTPQGFFGGYPREYYYGGGKLILTHDDVTRLYNAYGFPVHKPIYVQKIPPL